MGALVALVWWTSHLLFWVFHHESTRSYFFRKCPTQHYGNACFRVEPPSISVLCVDLPRLFVSHLFVAMPLHGVVPTAMYLSTTTAVQALPVGIRVCVQRPANGMPPPCSRQEEMMHPPPVKLARTESGQMAGKPIATKR